jgi:hypothetical protein
MSALDLRRAAFATLLACYHNSFANSTTEHRHSEEFIKKCLAEAGPDAARGAFGIDPRMTSTDPGAIAVGIARRVMTNEKASKSFIDVELGEGCFIATFDKDIKPEAAITVMNPVGKVAQLCKPGDKIGEGLEADVTILFIEPQMEVAEAILAEAKGTKLDEGSEVKEPAFHTARIEHLKDLIASAPAEDKVKLQQYLGLEQDRLARAQRMGKGNPAYNLAQARFSGMRMPEGITDAEIPDVLEAIGFDGGFRDSPIPAYDGKKSVKITSFGRRLNGADGEQGSITGEYDHAALSQFVATAKAKARGDYPTNLLRLAIDGGATHFVGIRESEEIDEAKNRWGHSIKKGMAVTVHHPRGGLYDDEIESFEHMPGYGRRVILKSGRSAGIDDVAPKAADAKNEGAGEHPAFAHGDRVISPTGHAAIVHGDHGADKHTFSAHWEGREKKLHFLKSGWKHTGEKGKPVAEPSEESTKLPVEDIKTVFEAVYGAAAYAALAESTRSQAALDYMMKAFTLPVAGKVVTGHASFDSVFRAAVDASKGHPADVNEAAIEELAFALYESFPDLSTVARATLDESVQATSDAARTAELARRLAGHLLLGEGVVKPEALSAFERVFALAKKITTAA